jgi:hypothetical protein
MIALEQRRTVDALLVDQDDHARSMVERVCSFLDEYARSQANGVDALRLRARKPLLLHGEARDSVR